VGDQLARARMLAWIASDLEGRQLAYAGFVRQCARDLAATPRPSSDDDTCPRCGDPIRRKTTGRPRKWCSDPCRKGRTKPDKTAR
jgi:hypothetical protein